VYHVFDADSVDPPSNNVPTRANSPSDVEIASATRDGSLGTLSSSTSLVNSNFSVANSVVNGINKKPAQTTKGEGAVSGAEVQITITFTPPIVLPAPSPPLNHYFFRPAGAGDRRRFSVSIGSEADRIAWNPVCG